MTLLLNLPVYDIGIQDLACLLTTGFSNMIRFSNFKLSKRKLKLTITRKFQSNCTMNYFVQFICLHWAIPEIDGTYHKDNRNRGHRCLGLAAIFAGMLYNVHIIQKSSTRNIMHVSIIVLELPAKLQWVID